MANETHRLGELPAETPTPRVERYAYRSFDRQWMLADTRLGDYLRPDLWRVHGNQQTYVTSLLTSHLGPDPRLLPARPSPTCIISRVVGQRTRSRCIAPQTNQHQTSLPELLDVLIGTYQRAVTPEDFLAYVYGTLSHPAFTASFGEELETKELRVPITQDEGLFEQARATGARLLWLHTYGERFVPRRGTTRQRAIRPCAMCPSGPRRHRWLP